MNLSRTRTLFHASHRFCRSAPFAPVRLRVVQVVLGRQTYATHAELKAGPSAGSSKPTAQSLLNSALDLRQRAARREDSAGPFTLGITPPRLDEVKPEKKWSELSAGGKGTFQHHFVAWSERRGADGTARGYG